MISEELLTKGYDVKILTNGHIFRKNIPNIFKQIRNWNTVAKNAPGIVIIHRSSNIIDYIMAKIMIRKCKIIFDYDDALFHIRFPGRIISYSYLNKILKISDFILVGSHYLEEYSRKFNDNVYLIPTAVDTNIFHPINKNDTNKSNQIVIGWLGSGTKFQLRYLLLLKEPLKQLSDKYDIKFKMISAFSEEIRKEFTNQGYEVDYGLEHWVPISETPRLISDFDIGVMPLLDEPFAKGKCAMKALEYMAMGIPVVVSAVGENNYAVKHNENGYLASNIDDWYKYLSMLIENKNLRKQVGIKGLKTVDESYSLKICVKRLISIIE